MKHILNFLFIAYFAITPAQAVQQKKNSVKNKNQEVIFIDPGHGGKDYGALSEGYGYEEKQLALSTSFMLKNYLQKLGYHVVMTRSQDIFVPLQERAEMANTQNADLFVSIHFNFCPNPVAHGVEIYYCKEEGSIKRMHESKKLAEEVLVRIIKHTGATTRGVKSANFVVIKKTLMPAILVECGFLSNHEERQKLKDPRYLNFIAWGVARGIDHYMNDLIK